MMDVCKFCFGEGLRSSQGKNSECWETVMRGETHCLCYPTAVGPEWEPMSQLYDVQQPCPAHQLCDGQVNCPTALPN